ncbi:MAG: cytochrome c biogenesis protein CcsA [Chloroflexi bacterium]|nr:cytochrome c biogenesis protein CcsA [Chloroflexota bacterium]
MADLGTMSLLLALALAAYAAIGSVAGARMGSADLVMSARRSSYMAGTALAVAVGAMVYAFVSHDFSIEYVRGHSNLAQDQAFTWVSMYAGNEGSLLYITFMLTAMSIVAIYVMPRRLEQSRPYTIAILMAIVVFFVTVMLLLADPFAPAPFADTDGVGVNPLLRHPGMFIHPPLQMAGLVGIAIPFAFVAGAMIAGQTRDQWLDAARVSAIAVWAVLSAGLLIGAWWAYTILGWGGYWSWDPIENVAVMPWLVLTAFIHSVMVQKRRGMFRMWNVALLSMAFVLAQFGLFINRGGPVVSVHSFGASTIGSVFLGFMLVSLAFALIVFLWRYPALKSDRPLESFLSREAAFLVNNFLFLGVAFVTLWGVLFPLFSEFANDQTVTVSAPWYNQINGPILLAIVILMGIGPLLPWRRTTMGSVQRWLTIPIAIGVATMALLWITGVHELWAVIGFGALTLVMSAVFEEWYRGTMSQRRAGHNFASGWWRMVNGNRPRHGGYIVHIAIIALGIGIIGTNFFHQRADVALAPGESFTLDEYRVEYVGVESEQTADRISEWANVNVFKGEEQIATLAPWRALYPVFNIASVRAAVHNNPLVDVPLLPGYLDPGLEDLYIVPSEFLADGRVVLRISINPAAWWLWVSGPIFIIGTLIALWPAPALERRTVPARTRFPSRPQPAQPVGV